MGRASSSVWLSSRLRNTATCGKLRRMMESYRDCASLLYANEPVSMSVMYLTILELWVASDKSACEIHPLLRDYDHEIRLPDCQCLLLTFREQMVRLNEVESYVESRRRTATPNRPSVFRDFGKPSSFAVKFFDRCSELQASKSQIEQDATQKKQAKYRELARLKKDYSDIMESYNSSGCETYEAVTDDYLGCTETRHKVDCKRCALLGQAKALTIGIYEWPLPPQSSNAKATVFEFIIPQAFSDWRDASSYVLKNVLGVHYTNATRPQYKCSLEQHHGLTHLLSSEYSCRRIVPISEVKSHTTTQRKLQQAVIDLSDTDVCLENALQYKYYDKALSVLCAEVRSTEEIPKKYLYEMPERCKALRRFLYKSPSSPDGLACNEVLASLADCPPHFSIDEFKAFCSIPLGQMILYSNLLAQLAIPVIDFAKPEVQCMVAQILYQVGLPLDEHIERTNHLVLTDAPFAHVMLDQLDTALGRIKENWDSWRAAATFVQLARRILSLNTTLGVQQRSLRFLAEARVVCHNWFLRLKQRVASSTDDDQKTELCSRATEIGLVCTTTFNVEHAFFDDVLRQPPAIDMLIQSCIVVQENLETVHSDFPDLHKSQLHAWRSLMFRILPKLRDHILHDSKGINQALLANWTAFNPAPGAQWAALSSPQNHWLTILSGALRVHYNLLTAELLVDGSPLARLPDLFMRHAMYTSLFGRSAPEVVPTDEPGLRFSAKAPFHGHELHFGFVNGDMLVVAIRGESRLDLLPPRLLAGQLPHAFVNDFFHWYDHKKNEVIFRSRASPWTMLDNEWRLKATGKTWRLVNGFNVLVNISSKTARTLAKAFSPLEVEQHLHISLDMETATLHIALPRLQLRFFLEHGDCRIMSHEHRGMMIDEDQSIGALIGLTTKLVLRHSTTVQEQRLLLIPAPLNHSTQYVSYTRSSNHHHVSASVKKDGPTRAYAYYVDKILGRILDSGDLQSKLFLCYLHALTSHCLPDPLTGYTGTEVALNILQSAAVRSFEMLHEGDIALLRRIASLSPLRSRPEKDRGAGLLKDWDMSNESIATIVKRCQDFEAMGFGSATLSKEQERELAPEIEEERQVERPPRMKAAAHVLHPDLMMLVRTGALPRATSAFGPAFSTLRTTSAAHLYNLADFPSDLVCTTDYVRTVKVPTGSTGASFVSDAFHRPVQWIMSVCGDDGLVVRHLIILSPFEANALLEPVKKFAKVTIHLFAPRANSRFDALDKLELYNVGRTFSSHLVSRSLTMQLNLFAGTLYLRSFPEYTELCEFLGLLQGKAKEGQQVYADGFIDPPAGTWGLRTSPVPFLRTLLMKIRREGEGVEKTHIGKILNGMRLEPSDFKTDG